MMNPPLVLKIVDRNGASGAINLGGYMDDWGVELANVVRIELELSGTALLAVNERLDAETGERSHPFITLMLMQRFSGGLL